MWCDCIVFVIVYISVCIWRNRARDRNLALSKLRGWLSRGRRSWVGSGGRLSNWPIEGWGRKFKVRGRAVVRISRAFLWALKFPIKLINPRKGLWLIRIAMRSISFCCGNVFARMKLSKKRTKIVKMKIFCLMNLKKRLNKKLRGLRLGLEGKGKDLDCDRFFFAGYNLK